MNPAPIRSGLPVQQDEARFPIAWEQWFSQAFQVLFAMRQSGPTTKRPTKGLWVGRVYFDTDLGHPVWYSGSVWVDAGGNTV